MPLDRILTHTENSVPPAFAWRIPGLKSETWGTHQLIQEVLTSRAQKGAPHPRVCQGEKYHRNEYQAVDNRSGDGLTSPKNTANRRLQASDQ